MVLDANMLLKQHIKPQLEEVLDIEDIQLEDVLAGTNKIITVS